MADPQLSNDTLALRGKWRPIAFWLTLAVHISCLPIDGTMALRNLTFLVLIALTIWQAWRRALRLDFPLFAPWLLYAGIACASLLYAVDSAYSLHELRSEIFKGILTFVIAASWIRTERQFRRLLWLVLIGNLIVVAGSAWSAWHLDPNALPIAGTWTTGVGETATAIVTAFPWLIALAVHFHAQGRYQPAGALLLLIAANLCALFLTMNRQGWLALFAMLAVMAMLDRRIVATRRGIGIVALLGCTMLALFTLTYQLRLQDVARPNVAGAEQTAQQVDKDVRWELWAFSLARIAEDPWQGGGFGREAFKLQYPDYYRTHDYLWHAHNAVLNKGVQMGIPGILAFVLLLAWLARDGSLALRDPAQRPWAIALLAMLIGVLVRNMTDDFFFRGHALLFWLIAGAFLGMQRQSRQALAAPHAANRPVS